MHCMEIFLTIVSRIFISNFTYYIYKFLTILLEICVSNLRILYLHNYILKLLRQYRNR